MVNDQLKEMSAGEELKRQRAEEQREQELWQNQLNKKL